MVNLGGDGGQWAQMASKLDEGVSVPSKKNVKLLPSANLDSAKNRHQLQINVTTDTIHS